MDRRCVQIWPIFGRLVATWQQRCRFGQIADPDCPILIADPGNWQPDCELFHNQHFPIVKIFTIQSCHCEKFHKPNQIIVKNFTSQLLLYIIQLDIKNGWCAFPVVVIQQHYVKSAYCEKIHKEVVDISTISFAPIKCHQIAFYSIIALLEPFEKNKIAQIADFSGLCKVYIICLLCELDIITCEIIHKRRYVKSFTSIGYVMSTKLAGRQGSPLPKFIENAPQRSRCLIFIKTRQGKNATWIFKIAIEKNYSSYTRSVKTAARIYRKRAYENTLPEFIENAPGKKCCQDSNCQNYSIYTRSEQFTASILDLFTGIYIEAPNRFTYLHL